jgi:predicted nuclease of predicted toxin-antitoxin system
MATTPPETPSNTLRLLANENVPGAAVRALAERGHDVAWVHERSPGASDDSVLAMSHAERRLLLTFDRDFGELVFRRGRSAAVGVILLRLRGGPDAIAAKIVGTLESRNDWAGHFAVITDAAIRLVPLPSGT